MREESGSKATSLPAEHEQWNRLSVYLEKLARENDKLEVDLVAMRKRREAITMPVIESQQTIPPVSQNTSKHFVQTSFQESRDLNDCLSTATASYENLRNDARTLLEDLRSFSTERGHLENQLKG